VVRPTQSIVYVPLQVIRFQSILLIVQYKYVNHFPEIFILQNLIIRTRSCGTGIITQSSWVFHFHQRGLVKMFCTTVVSVSKEHLGGDNP